MKLFDVIRKEEYSKRLREIVGILKRYRLATQGPRNLAEILERLQSGKLKVRHEIEDLKVITNSLVARMLIASLFIGSSMLLSQQIPPLIQGFSLIGIISCLTAVILGGRLLWAIKEEMT